VNSAGFWTDRDTASLIRARLTIALAQHGFADLTELVVLVYGYIGGQGCRRQDQSHELVVEAVFDRQQHAGDLDEREFRRSLAVGYDFGKFRHFLMHPLPKLAETQNPEGVADFLQ